MAHTGSKRRTQAERRTESRQAVLNSAVHLFGQQGYAATSLEEIAADSGLTIRPIYHYFGNKKALFAAVNELMEQRIIDALRLPGDDEPGAGIIENWRAYLDLCDDPAFRRIVLVDSPNVLGRERWTTSAVSEKARTALGRAGGSKRAQYRSELLNAVVMSAFTGAALMIAQADDIKMAKREAEGLIEELFSDLRR
jgi:AcrR family transcriptional regulator